MARVKKWLRVVLVTVASIAVLALALIVAWQVLTSRPLPDQRGKVTVEAGLGETAEIVRDDLGVTHITAVTREDAYFAQGYAPYALT